MSCDRMRNFTLMQPRQLIKFMFLLAPVAYLFWSHWPVLSGHLLSDSFSHIYNCYQWSENQETLTRLGQLFYQNINETGGAAMYRPLTIASYCLDYSVWGVQPATFKTIQLMLHIFSGLMVFYCLSKLCRFYRLEPQFPFWVVVFYWLFPLTPEVSAWVATRADSLVQIFMIAGLYFAWRNRLVWASVCLVLALMSKESAVMMVPMLVSVLWMNQDCSQSILHRLKLSFKKGVGFIVILVGYFVLRWLIFGQTTNVYSKSQPVLERIGENALNFGDTLYRLMLGPLGQIGLSRLWLGVLLVMMGYGIYFIFRGKKASLSLFFVFNIVMVLLALMTQFNNTDISGGGARVLYILVPWVVVLVCVPMVTKTSRTVTGALCLLLGLSVWLHHKVLSQWSTASQVSARIIQSVPDMAAGIAPQEWSLLLVPEYTGAALVGRNAQGSLVSPPFQKESYLSAIVPFIWDDLALWRDRVNSQFVAQLKPDVTQANQHPVFAFCLSKNSGYIKQRIPPEVFSSSTNWQSYWETQVTRHHCYF